MSSDEQLQRQEDERYRQIDRVIDKADADAADDQSDAQDGDAERPPQSDESEGKR